MSVEARGRPDIHDYPSGLSTSVQYFIYHTLCKRQISFINVSWLDKPHLAETAFHEQDRW